MDSVEDRLEDIKIENFIWFIYIGIILLSWYSNSLEKDYFVNNNIESKEKYRSTLIIIFSILLVVYYYFLNDSIESIDKLKPNASDREKRLVYLSFIGSLLIFISGLIFLYLAIVDKNLNVEIAFN